MATQATGRGSIPVLKPGSTITVSTSTSAATSAVITGEVIRIYSDVACFYKVGTGATTSDIPLPAETAEYIRVDYSNTLSVILASGTGTFYITVME